MRSLVGIVRSFYPARPSEPAMPQSYGTMRPASNSPVSIHPHLAGAAGRGPWTSEDGYFDMDATFDEPDVVPLIQVPYSRLVRNYTLVPVFTALCFVVFAALPTFFWLHPEHRDYPYSPDWREFLVGCAAWIVAFALRTPIYFIFTLCEHHVNFFTIALSTSARVLLEESLRLFAIVLLGIKLRWSDGDPEWVPYPDIIYQDVAFRKIWWFALGWAAIEVVFGIVQGYEQLALYRDVLEESSEMEERAAHDSSSDEEDEEVVQSSGRRYVSSILKSGPNSPPILPESNRSRSMSRSRYDPEGNADAVSFLEHEMAELMMIKQREELELVYGVPPPNIPVFISCLQRLDSLIITLGFALAISSAYLSNLASHPLHSPSTSFPPKADLSAALVATLPLFAILFSIHTALELLWTSLPKIGVHTFSYTALLVALGLFFAGLGSWGALS